MLDHRPQRSGRRPRQARAVAVPWARAEPVAPAVMMEEEEAPEVKVALSAEQAATMTAALARRSRHIQPRLTGPRSVQLTSIGHLQSRGGRRKESTRGRHSHRRSPVHGPRWHHGMMSLSAAPPMRPHDAGSRSGSRGLGC